MPRIVNREAKPQTIGEEVFNAVSHGLGAGLSIAGMVLMLYRAAHDGTPRAVASVAVFGAALVLLYLMSTLYHALPTGRGKAVLRIMDHISIFLLIAGTYTPYALIALGGVLGNILLGAIWALALLNSILNAISLERFRRLSMAGYMGMGWMALLVMFPLVRVLGLGGSLLLIGGGIAYTAGIALFSMKRVYFAHCVWHLFVMAGSALHFFSIYSYVLA